MIIDPLREGFRQEINGVLTLITGPTVCAKTRKGTPCQRPAKLLVGRFWLHGVRFFSPRTAGNLAQLSAGRTTYGKYTKEKRAVVKQWAEVERQMRAELAELEARLVDRGHLDKK